MLAKSALSVLAFAQAAIGQPQAVPHAIQGPPPPKVSGVDSCIPLSMSAGLPIIPVQIGSKTYFFAFDTGAPGGPMLRPGLIEDLRLDKIGEAAMSDPSGRNAAQVDLYRLPEMKVGRLVISDWVALGRPPRPPRFAEPDGVFGPQVFAGYVVTYDYPGSRLLIRKGQLPEADGRTRFTYPGPIPEVPLAVDGQAIRAHVDTGNARYGVILPTEFASKLPGYAKSFPVGSARTVNNQYDLRALPVASSSVGALPLYPGTASYPAPAKHANLGSPLLRDMIVQIDPARRIIAFERASAPLEPGCPSA